MTIVAHAHPFVIGVDTHAKTHALSILATPSGEIIEEATFPATRSGLARAVAWAGRRTGGDLAVLWVIECPPPTARNSLAPSPTPATRPSKLRG